jgi:sarcosine oxidase subunit alpha
LGKRAQERPDMVRADRWRLVGLEALGGGVLPEAGYVEGDGVNANGQSNVAGRVTSTYFSPTLGRGVAMALIAHGPERMGEIVKVWGGTGVPMEAWIVDPTVYDPEGEKQNV